MPISLKAYRVNSGYTIEQVAKELDINPATVSKWERGLTKPKKLYLEAMAKMYGVQLSDIFLGENPIKQ